MARQWPTTRPNAASVFRQELEADRVYTDPEVLQLYASDETPKRCVPEVVLFPKSHAEAVTAVVVANRLRIPLIPRGAGSGNVGGATPVPGSTVVSMECMNRIIEFNPDERLVVVEAGVVTADIDRLARTSTLFYPPNPGSAGYCRIGGNIATNAAGPRSLKYGVTKDYVLGLRAVTGGGRALSVGSRTSKGVVGYDLTRLLVGSEGTLAIVTEATLRLVPVPVATGTLRATYDDTLSACDAVRRVMRARFSAAAVEFLDDQAVAVARSCGYDALPKAARAMLLIEADGEAGDVAAGITALKDSLSGEGLVEIVEAQTAAESALLWEARSALSRALKASDRRKINEDVVVPVPRLSDLMVAIRKLSSQHRLPIVSFGHAGNGNLHINLMVDPADLNEMARAKDCLHDLFMTVLALKGTLSGEHGIGTEKLAFVPFELDPDNLTLQRQIKAQFDPNLLLNPGKAIPEGEIQDLRPERNGPTSWPDFPPP